MNAESGISRASFLSRARAFAMGLLGASTTAKAAASASRKQSDSPLFMQDTSPFRNATFEMKVQEIVDREDIRDLIARYAHRVAHGVSPADMFTDDGVFTVSIPGHAVTEARGRAALIKQHQPLVGNRNSPKPMIHNCLLSISGDEANGICSNEVRTTENGQSIIGSGYYDDQYRREDGRWKFAARNAVFFHWVPIQEGWASPKNTK